MAHLYSQIPDLMHIIGRISFVHRTSKFVVHQNLFADAMSYYELDLMTHRASKWPCDVSQIVTQYVNVFWLNRLSSPELYRTEEVWSFTKVLSFINVFVLCFKHRAMEFLYYGWFLLSHSKKVYNLWIICFNIKHVLIVRWTRKGNA